MDRGRLRQERELRGWTQLQAAMRIGVDRITWNRWEQGMQEPQPEQQQELCKLLAVTAEELKFTSGNNSLVLATALGTTIMSDNISSSLEQDLTTRLMNILWEWSHNDHYQELQQQINKAVDDYNLVIERDGSEFVVTRRDALRTVVLFAVKTCVSSASRRKNNPVNDLLAQITVGITACWYLRKGKELTLANDALDVYIPTLKAIMESERHREQAAALLVQAHMLKGTLARYLSNNEQSLFALKQAEGYTAAANNATLSVQVARAIAATHNFARRQDLALRYGEKARSLMSKATPLQLQSFVYAGLATYQAHCGRDAHEVLSTLDRAYKTFPKNENVVWFDHTFSNMLINEGEALHYLGKQNKSIAAFDQISKLPDEDCTMTGRVFASINIARAEVARDDQPRDMERAIHYWTQGIEGAKALRLELEFSDSRQVYEMLQAAWPAEPRVKALRGLMVHW